MTILYTCPSCNSELKETVITTYPSIYRFDCPNCGWSYEQRETIIKKPFEEHTYKCPSLDLFIKDNCANCSNNPNNGGTGICHCILGNQIYC